MRTENEFLKREAVKSRRNTALGIYVILATTFVSAYTLVQLFAIA